MVHVAIQCIYRVRYGKPDGSKMRMEETLRHSRRNVTSLTNTYVYCVNVRSRKNVRLLRERIRKKNVRLL